MSCTVCGKAMSVKAITDQIEQIRTDADILRKSSTYYIHTIHFPQKWITTVHENEKRPEK